MFSMIFLKQYIFVLAYFVVVVFALKCHVCSSDKMELCATLHFHSTNKVLPHELCAPDVTSCFTRIKGKFCIRFKLFVQVLFYF